MKTKEAMQISITTKPNGYDLTVNGEGFLYFNEVDLMAGFMAHVGLGETASMEKGSILSALMSAMLGDSYTDAVTLLKQRVGLLTSQYNTTIERMDKAIEYVTQAEKTINGFMRRLETIETQIRSTELDHADSKKVVDEVKKNVSSLQKKADEITNSLANSATIMKAMEDKETKSEKPTDSTKKKGRGGRNKAADEQVMKELEKKANNNPNIK
jgi:cysteinyl-tRNA synthetase